MSGKSLLFVVLVLVVAAAVFGLVWYGQQGRQAAEITSFEECAETGNPVMESYPPRCRTTDGRTFVQNVGNELEKLDLIRVSSPRPTAEVTDSISVSGEARGTWFFEASFPVHLEDSSGAVIASTPAQTEGEWMTEDFVPFSAELDIPDAFRGPATLVLERSNPSDLPEHADALRVPVVVGR